MTEYTRADLAKATKHSVEYGRGKPNAHCGLCRHYQLPSACAIVRGSVRPQDWCNRFEVGVNARTDLYG